MYDKDRKFPRLYVKSALQVSPFSNKEAEAVQLSHDISNGGCYFLSDQQYGVGCILTVQILLMSKTIKPTCRVVWENPKKYGQYDIGVEFLILSREEQDALENFISECRPVFHTDVVARKETVEA